jgi:excisionase family DNA binding protein
MVGGLQEEYSQNRFRFHSVRIPGAEKCHSSMSMRPIQYGLSTVECQWLTATEAANNLRVKPCTVLKWAKEGRIPAHPLPGSKRVTWRFLKRCHQPLQPVAA